MSTAKVRAPMEFQSTVVTTVDCQKQVRSWRLLRSFIQLLIPTCNCTLVQELEQENPSLRGKKLYNDIKSRTSSFRSSSSLSSSTVTGTIFGYRKGKINFCIQTPRKSTSLDLLLELAVPTTVLAREMRGGALRIVLERNNEEDSPFWNMYCNGKKVGYARKRCPSKDDLAALDALSKVVVGAGVVTGKELGRFDDELMYLRASFRRVSGSKESEAFHLIDPAGNIGQELSIFFVPSSV
ncbi:PREDICTED: protein MIZU-KUSSEI 1-like [Camelina sativa]|uniref:Protein MIZU-KUSSEI 1-like n=1 Tax=Camelina sativa TaxID=90675 RepID=A0ABM0TP35_CAMSA|nr:PREDICTED: protein MIZU-KUSSEI 1-like [Camelina sativa]